MAVQFRSQKYLKDIIDGTSIGTDNYFVEDNLKVVAEASKSLFSDLCSVYGTEKLTPDILNKPSVVKAQMAEWLFTAVQLMDYCCLPLMSSARSRIERLQEEKIEDQRDIIRLQNDLISQKNEELGQVSKTVETEMKSFSSVLQKNCSSALSPRNIATAVKSVKKQEDRSKELVVFGVQEEEGECLDKKVVKLLENLDEKPRVTDCVRIGRSAAGDKVRPIRFSVRNSEQVHNILRKAKLLKDVEGYKSVYISPNRTVEERISRQKLVSELKKKRSEDPNSNYFIHRGEVVKRTT